MRARCHVHDTADDRILGRGHSAEPSAFEWSNPRMRVASIGEICSSADIRTANFSWSLSVTVRKARNSEAEDSSISTEYSVTMGRDCSDTILRKRSCTMPIADDFDGARTLAAIKLSGPVGCANSTMYCFMVES